MSNFKFNGHRQITTMVPVEKIHGKMAPVKNTCNSSRDVAFRWMGGAAYKTTDRNSLVVRVNPRKSKPSSAELARQAIFTFARTWAQVTLESVTKYAQVVADFNAGKELQGCHPRAYRTVNGWCMAVRYAQKKEDPTITPSSTEYNQWPQE